MLGHGTPRTVRHVGLGFLLVLAAASDTEPLEGARAPELSGACYCRATAELRCVPDLTERDCARRCTEELCDDWFWLERRPCWGYGGLAGRLVSLASCGRSRWCSCLREFGS